MNNPWTSKTLLAGILFASLVPHVSLHAQTPALTSPGTGVSSTAGQTIGYTFTLSSVESLDALGLYDTGQSGTQEVGIWDTSGDLLASADVTVSSGDSGNFVYSDSITDSNGFTGTLSASTDYIIGTLGTGLLYDYSGGYPTTSSAVTVLGGNYSNDNSFEDPTTGPGGTVYVGPNFTYGPTATTPEPSTWALMLGGFGLLAFIVRRSVSRL